MTIRDMRKHAINMMFFGAGEEAIKEYIGKNIFLKNKLLTNLRKELRGFGSKIGILKNICDLPQYRDLKLVYSASKEAKESQSSVIAMILQTHEREINRETIEMVQTNGFEVTVSQFDGFQVRTQDRKAIKEVIKEINAEWKERGWFVEYDIKPFGKKISEIEVPIEVINNNLAKERLASYNLSNECIKALERICVTCVHDSIAQFIIKFAKLQNIGIMFNNFFYIFNKTSKHIWIEDTGEKEILTIVRNVLPIIEDYLETLTDKENYEYTLELARSNLGKTPNMKSIVSLLEKHYYVPDISEIFNQNPLLFAFQNGILEIIPKQKNYIFRDGKITDYITILMNYDYIDPNNKNENANEILEKLKKFLKSIHPIEEDLNYELKTGSWAIYGKPQAILWKVGKGANGKTILERMYSETFGKYAVKVSPGIFTSDPKPEAPTNNIYALRNARMIYTNEPRGDRFTIIRQNFLDISDQSKVSCRSNNKDQYEFKPHYFLACSCNSIPPIPDIDEAVIRRWKCILYDQKFITDYDENNPEPNTHKLKLEQDIFTDMEGYQPYFFNMLLKQIFIEEIIPKSSKILLKELIDEQNPYNDWFINCVERTSEESNVLKIDLWQSYCKYTIENNGKLACTINKFAKEMDRHFKVQLTKQNNMVFKNLKLKPIPYRLND